MGSACVWAELQTAGLDVYRGIRVASLLQATGRAQERKDVAGARFNLACGDAPQLDGVLATGRSWGTYHPG